jgi:hypothetical protein
MDFDTHTFNINLTNQAPTFTSGCGANIIFGAGAEGVFPFTANDNCSDALTYSVGTLPVGFVGTADMIGSVLHVYSDVLCPAGSFVFPVIVEDCNASATCNVTAQIILGSQYEVVIEKTHDTPQGQFETVAVTMEAQAAPIGGFNFLIAYDASALTFQGADVDGAYLYEDCGWEYFTYRYGPFGNCGTACPSGMLRVVGIGETNNGADHPTCYEGPVPYLLFNLHFLVSSNRTFECMYVPIRFFWIECGDNTISSEDGTQLFINDVIRDFDYGGTGITDIADYLGTLPTYLGAPDDPCLTSDKAEVIRAIGFTNGGIDIVCSKDIDDRGDINLNGLAYEIADAVMFSNYFIDGLGAFVTGYENGSIAATDVNADGLTLSVADLVYLIRVIVGDALPYDDPFLKPATSSYRYYQGVVSVEGEMGAAAFVFEGEADLQLMAEGMELKSNFDGKVTRALVYSIDGNTFTGDVVKGSGLVSIELGSAYGGTVMTDLVPSVYALDQNYPNPFNPTTMVPFSLPSASDVSLKVYNIAGQLVGSVSGVYEAGSHSIEFDGSSLSSGIYFYKLDAGTFTDTKKMVLLK